jgi:hypothetical protein
VLAQVRVLPLGLAEMGAVLGGRVGRAAGAAVGWLLGLPVLAFALAGRVLSGPAGLGGLPAPRRPGGPARRRPSRSPPPRTI